MALTLTRLKHLIKSQTQHTENQSEKYKQYKNLDRTLPNGNYSMVFLLWCLLYFKLHLPLKWEPSQNSLSHQS